MFYIRTADRLQRTATWLNKLEGGIDYLRGGRHRRLAGHRPPSSSARCSTWSTPTSASGRRRVEDPARSSKRFRPFVNSDDARPEHRAHPPAPAAPARDLGREERRAPAPTPLVARGAVCADPALPMERRVRARNERGDAPPRAAAARVRARASARHGRRARAAQVLVRVGTARTSSPSRTSIRSARRSCSRAASSATRAARRRSPRPIYKQSFDLRTGVPRRPVGVVAVWPVRVRDGRVEVLAA